VSAKIVALAKKYKSDIVFESLSNMKQHGRKKSARTRDLNYALSLFDYSKVASLVLYKARLNGIRVYDIMPGMTSKTCATCLLQSRESAYIRGKTYLAPNRKTYPNMKIGHCPLCHKNERSMIDADINAARVIALCKHKNLNDPRPFGSRWVFKRF